MRWLHLALTAVNSMNLFRNRILLFSNRVCQSMEFSSPHSSFYFPLKCLNCLRKQWKYTRYSINSKHWAANPNRLIRTLFNAKMEQCNFDFWQNIFWLDNDIIGKFSMFDSIDCVVQNELIHNLLSYPINCCICKIQNITCRIGLMGRYLFTCIWHVIIWMECLLTSHTHTHQTHSL